MALGGIEGPEPSISDGRHKSKQRDSVVTIEPDTAAVVTNNTSNAEAQEDKVSEVSELHKTAESSVSVSFADFIATRLATPQVGSPASAHSGNELTSNERFSFLEPMPSSPRDAHPSTMTRSRRKIKSHLDRLIQASSCHFHKVFSGKSYDRF